MLTIIRIAVASGALLGMSGTCPRRSAGQTRPGPRAYHSGETERRSLEGGRREPVESVCDACRSN